MARMKELQVEEKEILWSDKKRILGMPISFTTYSVDEDRLYMRSGFFKTETNEILLYRILDVKSSQTLGQKLLGVGTVTLYSADQSSRELELKNIRKPLKLHKYLSSIIEKERVERGIAGREIIGTAGMPIDMDSACHCDCCDGENN